MLDAALGVACRILKLLSKLPYSCCFENCTVTWSTALLASVYSESFHNRIIQVDLRLESDDVIIRSCIIKILQLLARDQR